MKYKQELIDRASIDASRIFNMIVGYTNSNLSITALELRCRTALVLLYSYGSGFENALPDDLNKHFQLTEIDQAIDFFKQEIKLYNPSAII